MDMRRGEKRVIAKSYDVSLRSDDNILELGSGDCCTALWIF